ncbi:uncharacterized protein LOC143553972 [Bidens hawaiensis]|uniref:uncharacterized protein LOC143553972 n=1 Tax=Bidens hawaiensis TaxID=980011 RepID=UPI004049EF0F
MDEAFKYQIGRNLEVYMDDLVIKRIKEDQMLRDIEETIDTLNKIIMKLNPSKCSFGMQEGKFLGVIVTSAGFKENPDKFQALARMPSPSSLKEVQTLNGRLVALNRFLANHAAKSFPFVSTLRNCLKKEHLKWTAEAEQAFLEVKRCLMELPTLTTPHAGGPLPLYLSASDIVIGAVLLTDRKNLQTPIYYVSRMLTDPESRYSMLEKLVLGIGVEAKPVASVTAASIKKFLWELIICRFGLPQELISDNGTQFADGGLQAWMKELQITQVFTSVAHPQANGQLERANRTIKDGIKKKTRNSETPFSLTYGTEAMIPTEIGVPSARTLSADNNEEELRMNLNLLEERRELALIREHNYKRQLQKYYNSRVQKCNFDAGDFVFSNNEASGQETLGKLAPTWEGPYKVKEVLSKGAYKLEKLDGTEIPRTWNVAQLKRCYM